MLIEMFNRSTIIFRPYFPGAVIVVLLFFVQSLNPFQGHFYGIIVLYNKYIHSLITAAKPQNSIMLLCKSK